MLSVDIIFETNNVLSSCRIMMRRVIMLLLAGILISGCGTRSEFKTRAGKKKLKKYNEIQFNKMDHDKSRSKTIKKH